MLVHIKLLDAEDGLKVGGQEGFLEFAKNKRFGRACEIWKDLVARGEDSYALLHNEGVCHEAAGDLDRELSCTIGLTGWRLSPTT